MVKIPLNVVFLHQRINKIMETKYSFDPLLAEADRGSTIPVVDQRRDPFSEMERVFIKNINASSVTTKYGCIGTQYLQVLCVQYGRIIVIGEFLYRIFREHLYTDESLKAFALECEKYRTDDRELMPVWCYKGDAGELTFED